MLNYMTYIRRGNEAKAVAQRLSLTGTPEQALEAWLSAARLYRQGTSFVGESVCLRQAKLWQSRCEMKGGE